MIVNFCFETTQHRMPWLPPTARRVKFSECVGHYWLPVFFPSVFHDIFSERLFDGWVGTVHGTHRSAPNVWHVVFCEERQRDQQTFNVGRGQHQTTGAFFTCWEKHMIKFIKKKQLWQKFKDNLVIDCKSKYKRYIFSTSFVKFEVYLQNIMISL